MVPARQHLQTNDAAGFEIDNRLVVGDYFAADYGVGQRPPQGSVVVPHGRVVDTPDGAAT